MSAEILPRAVYTTEEVQTLLKISPSTMKRLLKKGLIRSNKVGKQYRFLGIELLRLLSPDMEKEAVKIYLKLKRRVVGKINPW